MELRSRTSLHGRTSGRRIDTRAEKGALRRRFLARPTTILVRRLFERQKEARMKSTCILPFVETKEQLVEARARRSSSPGRTSTLSWPAGKACLI
jgi:hypothetical protein